METLTWPHYAIISIFSLGYLAIIFESITKINKTAISILMAVGTWTIFFISKNVSYRIYSEGMTFIVLFTFLCALAEGIIIFLMYRFLFGMNISYDLLNTYLPQSLAVAIVGPACFALFSRLEVLMYDKREK